MSPGLHGAVPVHDGQPLGAGQQAGPLGDLEPLPARGQRREHLAEHAGGITGAQHQRDAAHQVPVPAPVPATGTSREP